MQKLRVALTTVAFLVVFGFIAVGVVIVDSRPPMTDGVAADTKLPDGTAASALAAGVPSMPRGNWPATQPSAQPGPRPPVQPTLPVRPTTGTKPPVAAAVAAEGSGRRVAVERDRTNISSVVRGSAPRTRACFEQALARDPTTSGRLIVAWTITQLGTVSDARVEVNEPNDAELTNCVLRTVSSMQFGVADDSTEVRFPFVFDAQD
jgi:hypothetical protein